MCAENFSAMCRFYMALCSYRMCIILYTSFMFQQMTLQQKCPDVRERMNGKRQHLGFCLAQY